MSKIRNSILVAGKEQSGKTYFSEQLAKQYIRAGRPAVIYNVGKDADFSGAEICTPISKQELYAHSKTKNQIYAIKTVNYLPIFKDEKTGKLINFSDFNKFYRGKLVKIYRVKDEEALIKSFFMFLYDTLIIFDDNRAMTRGGLKWQHIELFSRKNHAGHRFAPEGKQGVDLMFIYHNLDKVPPELYDYVNRAIIFALNRVPENSIDNEEFYQHINESINELRELPRFSYCEIIISDSGTKKITHKKTN